MRDEDREEHQPTAASHYDALPESTRQFFENLRDEDVVLLHDGIRLVQALRTVSSFMKWLIIALVSAFIASVTLAENIMKVIGWFRGVPK